MSGDIVEGEIIIPFDLRSFTYDPENIFSTIIHARICDDDGVILDTLHQLSDELVENGATEKFALEVTSQIYDHIADNYGNIHQMIEPFLPKLAVCNLIEVTSFSIDSTRISYAYCPDDMRK